MGRTPQNIKIMNFQIFKSFRVTSRLRYDEPNFRQKEKEILDRVLGMDRYDSRIRPAGMQNDTSKKF